MSVQCTFKETSDDVVDVEFVGLTHGGLLRLRVSASDDW